MRQKTKWKFIRIVVMIFAVLVGAVGYYAFTYTNIEPTYILLGLGLVFVAVVVFDLT